MDTTETNEPVSPEASHQLVLGPDAKYFLHTAGRWATFLGILGFISTGLIALCAFFVGSIFAAISRINPMASTAVPGALSTFITVVYLMLAVFYFFLSYYLYQFGTKIKTGTSYSDQELTTLAFKNLKSHFKLIGITTIVVICLYIVGIISAIFVAVHAASAMQGA